MTREEYQKKTQPDYEVNFRIGQLVRAYFGPFGKTTIRPETKEGVVVELEFYSVRWGQICLADTVEKTEQLKNDPSFDGVRYRLLSQDGKPLGYFFTHDLEKI